MNATAVKSFTLAIDVVQSLIEKKSLARDRFLLTDDILGQPIFGGEPSFPNLANPLYPYFGYRTSTGKLLSIPGNLFLNGRILNKDWSVKDLTKMKDKSNIYVGKSDKIVTDNSGIVWEYFGLKEKEEFKIPSTIKLFGAVLSCDSEGNPMPSYYSYEFFYDFWKESKEAGRPTSFTAFQEALKVKGDARLKYLPKSMTTPQLKPELVGNLKVSDYMFRLVFQDIRD